MVTLINMFKTIFSPKIVQTQFNFKQNKHMKRKIRSISLFQIKPITKFPASKNKKCTTAEMEGIFPETLVILLLNISKFLRSTYHFSLFVPLRMRDAQCYCVLHRMVTNYKLPKSRLQIANKKLDHLGLESELCSWEENL